MALSIITPLSAGAPLGFMEQRFAYLHFEEGKWTRVFQSPCYVYTARGDKAVVDLLGIGATQLIPFRAKKGLSITACGEVVALDEGFETAAPVSSPAPSKH